MNRLEPSSGSVLPPRAVALNRAKTSFRAPVVSVVMPVYNAERYVAAAIRSVLSQTFTDFELVVVDDGSTDGSLDILVELAAADGRVQVISRPNTGIVGALNDGWAVARGEFVARMDADDLCMRDRLDHQVAYLRQAPDCVCVGSAFVYIDALGYCLDDVGRPTDHTAIEAELLHGNGGVLVHPTAMVRRAALEQVGGYRPHAEWIEDLDLYLRLARIGRLANLPERLLHYRLHEKSVNFTRNAGRLERKYRVLAEAYDARGLPFAREGLRLPVYKDALTPADLGSFAIRSLAFGPNGRPWYYTFRTLQTAPWAAHSWRVFSYVAQHKFGLLRK